MKRYNKITFNLSRSTVDFISSICESKSAWYEQACDAALALGFSNYIRTDDWLAMEEPPHFEQAYLSPSIKSRMRESCETNGLRPSEWMRLAVLSKLYRDSTKSHFRQEKPLQKIDWWVG